MAHHILKARIDPNNFCRVDLRDGRPICSNTRPVKDSRFDQFFMPCDLGVEYTRPLLTKKAQNIAQCKSFCHQYNQTKASENAIWMPFDMKTDKLNSKCTGVSFNTHTRQCALNSGQGVPRYFPVSQNCELRSSGSIQKRLNACFLC